MKTNQCPMMLPDLMDDLRESASLLDQMQLLSQFDEALDDEEE